MRVEHRMTDDDSIVIISSHYVEDVFDAEHIPCDQFDPIDDLTPLRRFEQTKTERNVARAVVIVTMTLLVLSVLMIMVSLTMSHHIDDLVRQANKKLLQGAIKQHEYYMNHTDSMTTDHKVS